MILCIFGGLYHPKIRRVSRRIWGSVKRSTAIVLRLFLAAGLGFGAAVLFVHFRRHPLTITGAVIAQSSDYRKELPIANVEINVADGLAIAPAKSNSSGFFALRLLKRVHRGDPITLSVHHPGYQPLELHDFAADKLYIVHMQPIPPKPRPESGKPAVKIGNVVVRYSFKTLRSIDVGSAVKTFEIINNANIPCDKGPVCSPDGKWKASVGTLGLSAGPGNEFHNARLSCIAGPCPFTRILSDNFAKGGPTLNAKILNWSDTTTFLVEAEVNHFLVAQTEHQSYPVIFDRTLDFTLPADAEGLSLQADMAGENIIFPLGPDLLLSWATCSDEVNQDQTKLYRCEVKPGYQLQP
jgi:hypothetical protein